MIPRQLPIYEGAAAWTSAELCNRDDWIVRLADAEVAELIAATRETCRQDVEISDMTRRCFELPLLAPKLRRIRSDIFNGRGFVVVKGLPVDRLSREEIARCFFGIGSHLGDAVPQNGKGHLIGHVKDIGLDPNNPRHRIYATRGRQPYHVDSCDVVGLLCLKPARSGGLFSLASSTAIYNTMAKARPDLARVLEQPFFYDRKGEIPPAKDHAYEMPIFHHTDGKMTVYYARDFIAAAQCFDDVPCLADKQIEAMDMIDELARDPAYHMDIDWRPGDAVFAHNHQILHARTAYEDFSEPEQKRHLMRLWLAAREDGRRLPLVFAERYGHVDLGRRRGGIRVPAMKLTVPLEAE